MTTVFFNGSKPRFATLIRMSDYFNPFILYQTMSFSIYFHRYLKKKSLGSLADRPNIHERFPPVNIWHLVCRLVGLQFPGMIHITCVGIYYIEEVDEKLTLYGIWYLLSVHIKYSTKVRNEERNRALIFLDLIQRGLIKHMFCVLNLHWAPHIDSLAYVQCIRNVNMMIKCPWLWKLGSLVIKLPIQCKMYAAEWVLLSEIPSLSFIDLPYAAFQRKFILFHRITCVWSMSAHLCCWTQVLEDSESMESGIGSALIEQQEHVSS